MSFFCCHFFKDIFVTYSLLNCEYRSEETTFLLPLDLIMDGYHIVILSFVLDEVFPLLSSLTFRMLLPRVGH